MKGKRNTHITSDPVQQQQKNIQHNYCEISTYMTRICCSMNEGRKNQLSHTEHKNPNTRRVNDVEIFNV